MSDMTNIVKLAIDNRRGSVEKYSLADSNKALREALIEVNNGKTSLDIKAIRDGKCPELFGFIETVISSSIYDELQNDDYFMSLVDMRNIAMGDENIFLVEDADLYVVDDAARGTLGIRRQRLGGPTEVPVPTKMKLVRIYEELDRVLAGRVDWNVFIDKAIKSFRLQLLNDVYSLWADATNSDIGGTTFYPTAGAYNESTLLTLIEHVEAAAGGKTATIIGTKAALRNLAPALISDQGKEDIYNMGYVGKFYGSPVVAVPQRHKVGTTNFVFDDKKMTIVAGDSKPIKVVIEGDPIMVTRDPFSNADMTHEFYYGERVGMGLVLSGGNGGYGIYDMHTD
jgi:hypothetical protein